MSFAVSDKSPLARRERPRASPKTPVAAMRSLPARASSASSCACGGGCPRCQARTKTRATDAQERHERQADRVAAEITSGKTRLVPPAIDAAPAGMQTKSNAESTGAGAHGERRIARDRGTGRPLPDSTRGFMEERFGADFGAVRLHTGAHAARVNAELDARAFTYGADIWLGANESAHDRKLMAHELTHVLQQRAGGAYIARQPKDDKPAGTDAGAKGTGTTGAATAGAATGTGAVSGCDKKTTGVDNATDILLSARAVALGAVQTARAAFKPLKSSTILLLDRHFHCPSTTQIKEVMNTLAAIEKALPTLPVRCLGAKDQDCADGSKGQALDSTPELHTCPPYFAQDVSDVFRAVTFIFAAAAGIGRHKRCRRGEACYDDYMQTVATMLDNPYSYAWFAVEAAGLSPPDTGIVPCRPLEMGIEVVVPPAAKKDPTQIRRLSGFDPIPQGSEIVSVWADTSGKYFIYHDDIPGARAYLPGEQHKRYYFPDGKRP